MRARVAILASLTIVLVTAPGVVAGPTDSQTAVGTATFTDWTTACRGQGVIEVTVDLEADAAYVAGASRCPMQPDALEQCERTDRGSILCERSQIAGHSSSLVIHPDGQLYYDLRQIGGHVNVTGQVSFLTG